MLLLDVETGWRVPGWRGLGQVPGRCRVATAGDTGGRLLGTGLGKLASGGEGFAGPGAKNT